MAGRIRDEDIALVRERSPIAEVVGEHVTLRSAGSGSLKGLCPFHDEKTPSFNVSPSRGFFHCFGCQEGGDVIDFVRKLDHLGFTEAVERLAARARVDLRYEEGGYTPGRQQGQRTRLLEAHRAAAQFYAEQLAGTEAQAGREFLAERGFDLAAAERFGVGYAPEGWDVLTRHLRGRGFTDRELMAGGLAREGQRGPVDRFRGRLVWPIRDVPGDVIGFGARRLRDDDSGPKYLNTPESPLYKKSTVLYGVDLAKRDIARRQQAVVVEGYTDVMACHLSGVETAVATCGTAFGTDHIKVLRRLLMDQNEFRGEVVFTFDGDEAGRKAALKAFDEDQRFVAQTFVAVQPDGLDPCELRQRHGPEAVRELVARRVPLFEFAIRSLLARHDLDIPEGRVAALQAAAPIVASVRDRALRPEYVRTLAGWLGMEVEAVAAVVARAGGPGARSGAGPRGAGPRTGGGRSAGSPHPGAAASGVPAADAGGERSDPAAPAPVRPDPDDPELYFEREALKAALQHPQLSGEYFDTVEAEQFLAPGYTAVRRAIAAAGGTGLGVPGEAWVAKVRAAAVDDDVRSLVTELAVEPLRAPGDLTERNVLENFVQVQARHVTRAVVALKSRLQRLNPVEQAESYNRLFGELVALEAHRRALRERVIGDL